MINLKNISKKKKYNISFLKKKYHNKYSLNKILTSNSKSTNLTNHP